MQPEAQSSPDPLQPALDAFGRGDYHLTRELTAKWTGADDPSLRARAIELRNRTNPDRVQIAIIAASFVLFAVLTYIYVLS